MSLSWANQSEDHQLRAEAHRPMPLCIHFNAATHPPHFLLMALEQEIQQDMHQA